MKVLETIPPNYVILVPKNQHGDGVMPCTLVPREMVANMLHVYREGSEGDTYEETTKSRDTNYKDDRIATISSNDIKKDKQVSDEKEVDDYIEYNAGSAGYTEPVYEEHIEHNKVRSNKITAEFFINYFSITGHWQTLSLKQVWTSGISQNTEENTNQREVHPKFQPSLEVFLVAQHIIRKKQITGDQILGEIFLYELKFRSNKSTRQAENEYEPFEHDDRRTSELMDRQLKHNMGIMGL